MTKTQLSAKIAEVITSQGNQVGVGDVASIFNEFVDLIYALAPEYDATKTYLKDALVIYNGKVYAAKQNIGTAEAWTAAHWEERTIAAAIALKADAQ